MMFYSLKRSIIIIIIIFIEGAQLAKAVFSGALVVYKNRKNTYMVLFAGEICSAVL